MSKKILIVGGNGYVGSTLARSLSHEYEVHATYNRSYTPIENVTFHRHVNIADKDDCRALAMKVMCESIIYCVGKNDPAIYESDQNLAQYVLSGGPSAMLTATEVMKPQFIMISSNYVFAGNEGNYSESSTSLAFNQFGKAKAGGENSVRTRSLNHTIIRCAPLLGRGTLDHPSWLDDYRTAFILNKPIIAPTKVYHNPTHVNLLVDAVKKSLLMEAKNKTLHIGGLSKVSTYEFLKLFAGRFGFESELVTAPETEQISVMDYSLNFTQTIKLIQTEALFLEQHLDLLE